MSVILQSGAFQTVLEINTDGSCSICDDGIVINTIAINENIGDIFTKNLKRDRFKELAKRIGICV